MMNHTLLAHLGRDEDNPFLAVLLDRDGVLTKFDIASATQFFDGLLPISVFALFARWEAAGGQMGFPASLEEERQFFGRFWAQLADEFSLDGAQRAKLAGVDYTRFVVSFAETPAVLPRLRGEGLRLGVLSNFSLASLEQSLLSAGLAHWFDAICAATVIGHAKPAAQAYQVALDALGVRADDCLYIDDEVECIEGARRLGMTALHLDRRAAADDFDRHMITSLHSLLEPDV